MPALLPTQGCSVAVIEDQSKKMTNTGNIILHFSGTANLLNLACNDPNY